MVIVVLLRNIHFQLLDNRYFSMNTVSQDIHYELYFTFVWEKCIKYIRAG